MWKRVVLSEYLVLWLCLAYFVIMLPLVPGWASTGSVLTMLSAMLPLLVVAVGQTLVMIVAGIDLSITAVIASASVLGAIVMTGDGAMAGSALAAPAGVVVMLLVGLAIGALNGFSVAFLRMPPLLVTLASMLFFTGAGVWMTAAFAGSSSIAGLPGGFTAIGQEFARVNVHGLWVAAAIVLAAHFLLGRTVWGQWLYAIGINRTAARISGVPVRRMVFAAFLVSGLCAAVAAILLTARMETGSASIWPTYRLLDVIGAVVIGGTSLYGGKGKVIWTVFGVLFLVQVDQSLGMLGLSDATVRMAKGGLILLAATLDTTRTRLQARQ